MGRFTAYDQNGRMVADFDKSDYDFLCRYGRTPEEVLDENAKLRELMYERAHVYAIQNMTEDELRITATNVMEDNAKLRELFSSYWKRTHSPVGPNVERDYLSEMRELGIEWSDAS